jgi:hypothetical protein
LNPQAFPDAQVTSKPAVRAATFIVGVSKFILHEADLPDLVGNFAYAHELAGEHDAEGDLTLSPADAAASGHVFDIIVIRVAGLFWGLESIIRILELIVQTLGMAEVPRAVVQAVAADFGVIGLAG